MYPAHFFSLFPPFPKDHTVFIAMSFDPRFDGRWRDVIAPAVGRISVNDRPLEPVRVDTRNISDSILTEILTGISDSRLVFADITTIGHLDRKPIRNGNVMYEVGLAQAARLPEEVILFRSDDDPLLFDTSTIRVNSYSPDNAAGEAQNEVSNALLGALREIDLRKHLTVQKAAEMLDIPSVYLLFESLNPQGVPHPVMKTMGNVLANSARAAAISRLLEMGALRTKYLNVTPKILAEIGDSSDEDIMKYECTEFGHALINETTKRLGVLSPDIRETLEKRFQEDVQSKQADV
jgi:hypothetical protein